MMKPRKGRLCVTVLLWLWTMKYVKTDGKLDIRFNSYWSDGKESSGHCCDSGDLVSCPDKCDPMFVLCIDGPHGRAPCSLYKSSTNYIDNHNVIHFGNSIQGIPNPFIIPVAKPIPSSIVITVLVVDNDDTSSDDHMDTLSKLINIRAAATQQTAMYTKYTLSGRTNLKIAVRAYCDLDWYGSTCEKYCKATTDHSHYTCHPHTGEKMCFEGWKGDNCYQDIDECTETDQRCQHKGTCTNTPGSFECVCMEGIKGKLCENVINQCALEPCLNGGTCSGNGTDFKCACPVDWTGETCAKKVNVCDSSPCNMGHCTPDLLTATQFKCDCGFAWIGDKCSKSVDIINITLLGEIDHTNRGDLAEGLTRLITELGEISGKVDVKFTTNTQKESNYTATYVQLYAAVDNGSFLGSASLARIFESNSDDVINEYMPLDLYPSRDEEEVTAKSPKVNTGVFQSPHDSWNTNQYMSAILPPVGLVLMSALLLVAFWIWRRRLSKKAQSRDDNQQFSFVMGGAHMRNLQPVTENLQETRLSPDGYTSLRFLEVDEGSPNTHSDGTSNIKVATEDMTTEPENPKGFSGYSDDNARRGDVASFVAHCDITSDIHLATDDMTLDEVIVRCFGLSLDDNARRGDVAARNAHSDVTSNLDLATEAIIHDQVILRGSSVSPGDKTSLVVVATLPQATEDLTLDQVMLQDPIFSPHDNTHPANETTLQDVHVDTLDTHCDETSNTLPTTETGTLDSVRLERPSVNPDDQPRFGDVRRIDARRHVTSYIQPIPGDKTLDPECLEVEEEDAEYTTIDDNDAEDLLQEDPYETIGSLDDNDVENTSQKDPYEKINL